MKKLFIIYAALLMVSVGCQKNEVTIPQTYKGVEQTLGNGKAYSWVTFSESNLPSSIGMTFTKEAFDNLSHTALTALVLPLPTEAVGKTIFDHVFLTFSHAGHFGQFLVFHIADQDPDCIHRSLTPAHVNGF